MTLNDFLTQIQPADIAPLIDHTVLSALTSQADITRVVEEAKQHRFAAVCIPPRFVEYAAKELEGSAIGIATVVNFPLANEDIRTVSYATQLAIEAGATEIDMVANPNLVGKSAYAEQIRAVAETVKLCSGNVLKVIIEAGYLTPEQVIEAATTIAIIARDIPDLRFFTKTSTGMAVSKLLVPKYSSAGVIGARVEDLEKIYTAHQNTGVTIGIKASGGISTFDEAAKALYAMGARYRNDLVPTMYRIGASAGVKIIGH
ncbi:MAG: deoxyribose-phosphate aldolase [Candidatus Woesearchaeota archaeon]|jgi:deoxyribose-phosphate aldolase